MSTRSLSFPLWVLCLLCCAVGVRSASATAVLGPENVALSPDGKRLYVANSARHAVQVVDTATGQVVSTIPLGNEVPETIYALAVSPDGARVYVASSLTQFLWMVDPAAGKVVATYQPTWLTVFKGTGAPGNLLVRPDGKRVFIAYSRTKSVEIVNADDLPGPWGGGKGYRSYGLGPGPQGLALSRDGQTLYVTHTGWRLGERLGWRSWVVAVDVAEREWRNPRPVIGVALAGDETVAAALTRSEEHLLVTNHGSDTVSVFTTGVYNFRREAEIRVGTAPWGIAISPDGRWAYVANSGSDTLSVIRITERRVMPEFRVVATIPVGRQPQNVAISPDGTRVYVSNKGSGSVSVIDAATLRVEGTIPL